MKSTMNKAIQYLKDNVKPPVPAGINRQLQEQQNQVSGMYWGNHPDYESALDEFESMEQEAFSKYAFTFDDIYQLNRQEDRHAVMDGKSWMHILYEEWEKVLGLSPKETKKVIKQLREEGLIESKKHQRPGLYWRVVERAKGFG